VRHRTTASFWKHYEALPKAVQTLADKNFELLKLDPYHPSLHFKNVSRELWSARVGMHFRALALPDEAGFTWIWIGTHGEYDRLIN
jgi:hypothetical protein